MGLKEFYYSLEDKYFEMLDNLEEKGINLYKIIDPLEKNGISTFPIFSLIVLALIALIIFLLVSNFTSIGSNEVRIAFFDETQNPIQDTDIKIKLNGVSDTVTTDNSGVVYLSDLDKTKLYELELDDASYKLIDRDYYDLNPTTKYHLINIEKIEYQSTKTISFKKQSGELLLEELDVIFECTNGNYTSENTITEGLITLSDIPKDCGRLTVTILGRNDYTPNIPEEGTVGEVRFSESISYGTLSITVKDKDSLFNLANVNVSIYDKATDMLIDSDTTNQNGIMISESVIVNKQYYVLVSDPNSIYSTITKSDYQNNLISFIQIKQGMNTLDLKLKKDIIGFIEVRVKDKVTGALLEGVNVKLSRLGNIMDTRATEVNGQVKFPIKENVSYILTLDKPGYLLQSQTASISSNIIDISLRSMTETGNYPAHINVVDGERKGIEYATVKIWDVLNNEVVKVVTTDISGKVVVNNLNPEGTYFVEAISGKFTGKSNNFTVKEREIEEVYAIVEIGQGTYNLVIMDDSQNPISAPIKVYDVKNNKEMEEKRTTSNESGLAIISIRADKTVFFSIETDQGNVITKQYNVPAENTFNETIIIPAKISSSSNIEFIGFYNSSGEIVSSIIPGQTQTARFLLNVDKKYSKVVAHLRTGEGDTCGTRTYSANEDFIYIKQVSFAGSKMIGSLDYTPCFGETKDLASIVTKNTKWVNLVLDNPVVGSYLIDAEIVVLDSATTNQSIYYRAEYQQGTTVLRNPLDATIGTSTSSSTKQALYAYAKNLPIFVGDTSNCDGSICYSFAFREKNTSQDKRVIDKFSAKDGTDYKFKFRFGVLRPVSDATIKISTTGQTIKLNSYTISPAGSLPIVDTEFSDIDIGSISANDIVTGEVDLSVINDISDELVIEISSNGDAVFEKKILFDLKPSKNFTVEFLPKMVVPYIPNNAIIGVMDDTNKSVMDASVFVKINSKPIIDGKTNREGLFTFILPATNINDVIEINVRKQGYRTNTIKYVVTENIITTIPESIELNIDISQNYSTSTNIILINNTVLPLSITSIKTNVNSEYVKLTSASQGMIFEPNSQVALDLTARLTEAGIDLMTQKTIKGTLLITVNESNFEKNWQISIPITIRITFGQAIDNTNCLIIDPEETEIRMTDTEYAYNLNITNDCQVGEVPVSLNKIFIESNYKDTKKLGDFYVVIGAQEKKLALEEKIQVLNSLDAGKKATIKLIYKMNNNTKGGISTPVIRLTSNRANINGVDTIVSEHLPKIIINNYINCIETPTTQIIVPYCAPVSLYNNMFGMGPYTNFSQNFDPTMYNQQSTTIPGQSYWQSTAYAPSYAMSDFYNNQNFPYNNFTEGMQGYPMSGMTNGQTGCQAAQIQVKNSCYDEVELKFDSLAGVIISSGQEMALKKGESKTLTVQGGQVLGEYKIAMSAKPTDDAIEEYTFVKDLPVIVNRPLEILPENCIIVPKTKFDFTYTTDIQKLMVINSCYDAGFALTSLRILNPDVLMIGDVQYFSIGDVNATLRPKKTYRYEEGKRIEIMTVGVRRNPEIGRKMLNNDNDTTAKTISNLRKNYFDIGNSINLTAILGISYSTPRLQGGEKEEELTFTDNLQWLGYVDENKTEETNTNTDTGTGTTGTGTTPGTTNADVSTRINIDFTTGNSNQIPAGPAIEFTEFALNDNSGAIGILVKIKDSYLDDKSDFFNNETDARVCFNGVISDFKKASPSIFEKLTEKSYIDKNEKGRIQNGEVISEIHFFEKGTIFKVCLSRPLTPLNTADGKFDRAVYREETDVSKEKIFTIMNPKWWIFKDSSVYKVKFALSANLGTFGYIEKTNVPEYLKDSPRLQDGECLDPKGFEKLGFTGSNYDNYGFNRLLFTWNPAEIKHNTCDYGYIYCDQDQLRIAFSQKMDYLANNKFIELDGIKFLKSDSVAKIAKNELLLDKNPLNKELIENAVSSNAIDSAEETKLKITKLRTIINTVPEALRKYTIIEIAIPVGAIEGLEPIDLNAEKVEAFTTKMAGSTKITFENTNTIKRYQFNVNTFLNTTSNLSTEIDGLSDAENKLLSEYLRRFINSMNVYYGDTLTPVIINAKTYGSLESGATKDILSKPQFLNNAWELNLKSSSEIKQISSPATYKITLDINNSSSKKANYDVTAINAGVDAYSTNNNYKQNIFFTNPVNAYYYNYGGIPFKTEERGERKQTELINSFNNWAKVQDGIVLKANTANNAISNVLFKDIRPIQIVSTVANDYRVEYLAQEKYNNLVENMEWRLSAEEQKLIKQTIQRTGSSTNGYQLLNYNSRPTTFRNTIFVFNNSADKSKLEHQLRIYSRNELLFNVTPISLQMTNVSDNKAYGYAIPKNLTTVTGYVGKLDADTATVNGMIKSIQKEKMCFNFNNGTFNLWINPADKSIVEVVEVETQPTTSQQTAQVPQQTTQTESTTTQTIANLTITGGSFSVDTSVTSQTTVNVIGDNLTMDLANKKLNGVVKFESGNQNATVNITSGTAVISGNNVTLTINGTASAGLMGTIRVTTQGTLNTTGNQNLDGTYTIVANQSVNVNGPQLALVNINFNKQ